MPKYRKTSDYAGFRGRLKDGAIVVSMNTGCDTFSFSVGIEELGTGLGVYGNSNWVIRDIVRRHYYDATERWIDATKNAKLRDARRKNWERDPDFSKGSSLDELAIDGICRLVRDMYMKATGEYPRSWFEKVVG